MELNTTDIKTSLAVRIFMPERWLAAKQLDEEIDAWEAAYDKRLERSLAIMNRAVEKWQ